MKTIRNICFALAVCIVASGCAHLHGSSAKNRAQEENEIHQWLEQWQKACEAHDFKTVMALYSPEVIAYDVGPPLQVKGAEAYGKGCQEFFNMLPQVKVEFRDVNIIAGRKTAVVYGFQRLDGTTKDGKKMDVWFRFTTILRKSKGQWLDVHDHVSVPVDMGSGKALMDLKP